MKVIQKMIKEENENKSYQVTCEECGSLLEITKNDVVIKDNGCSFYTCPCCNTEQLSEISEFDLDLTIDNINYPQHFYDFTNGADLSDEEILDDIKRGYEYCRKNKKDYYYCGSGNSIIFVFRLDGDEEYNIIVCKNYLEAFIPFDDEDKE